MNYRESLISDQLEKNPTAWPWLAKLRQEAYERFKVLGFPGKELEGWKKISLESLLSASFVHANSKAEPKIESELLKKSFLPEEKARIVFLNGIFSDALSSMGSLPHGVFLNRLAENLEFTPDIVEPYLASDPNNESNAFSLINTFSFKDGAFVYLPEGTVLDGPLHILFEESSGADNAKALDPRILIVLGARAKASVIVNFIGHPNAKYFRNAHAEIHLGPSAALDYTTVQRESKDGFSFLSNRYTLSKESALNVMSFSQGGLLTRNENEVRLNGERAFASLKGLSMLSGESQVFYHVVAEHLSAHCTSRQFYKNILADKSRSEFNSLVHVGREAPRSDSNQLNRNLLLSDQAESYSRPKLQIDNDDVACTHGATAGQLEKDELFYLRSRGLSKDFARFVLTYGFAEEILAEVRPLSLRTQLESLVNEELKRMVR